MNRKKFYMLILGSTMIMTSSLVNASTLNNGEIPAKMLPGTEITFDSNNQPIITSEGAEEFETPISINPRPEDETSGVPNSLLTIAEVNEAIHSIKEEAKDLPVYEIPDLEPQPGTVVTYGSDGYINTIENELPGIEPYFEYQNGIFTYGDFPNIITVTDTQVCGEGRFTVFTDKIGDHDNILVAGDVATKMKYDNPKSGTKLTATANEITKIVTKNDVGSLPNAVLDLKNWNGVMFGHTYNKYLSFPGSYFYNR